MQDMDVRQKWNFETSDALFGLSAPRGPACHGAYSIAEIRLHDGGLCHEPVGVLDLPHSVDPDCGLRTKIYAVVDEQSVPIRLSLTTLQSHDAQAA